MGRGVKTYDPSTHEHVHDVKRSLGNSNHRNDDVLQSNRGCVVVTRNIVSRNNYILISTVNFYIKNPRTTQFISAKRSFRLDWIAIIKNDYLVGFFSGLEVFSTTLMSLGSSFQCSSLYNSQFTFTLIILFPVTVYINEISYENSLND